MVNIYGPNKDDLSFYENLFKSITEIGNDSYIICGEFNLTLNPNIDCFSYKHINNPKARKIITNMIKIINVIEKENGEMITNQKEILNETCKYYENLYASKENGQNDIDLNVHMQNINIPKLNGGEASNLEGMLTLKEAGQTLKNMKNNKSPGTSGFSADFFKAFWKQLCTFVVRAINFGLLQGELSVTQQRGLIVCIPKENKCRNYLKNW